MEPPFHHRRLTGFSLPSLFVRLNFRKMSLSPVFIIKIQTGKRHYYFYYLRRPIHKIHQRQAVSEKASAHMQGAREKSRPDVFIHYPHSNPHPPQMGRVWVENNYPLKKWVEWVWGGYK
jgi:hypothetical protein